MQWLKDMMQQLPLEYISEQLARLVFWWTQFVDGVPEEQLARNTYMGASIIVLLCLYFVLKLVPKFLRGVIWIASAAILLTPGGTLGDQGGSAPAIIGVVHGLLMGDMTQSISAFLPILAVMIFGLLTGAMWQFLRASLLKSKTQKRIKKEPSTPIN